MSFEAPPAPQVAAAPPPPPMFGEKATGGKKKPKSQQATFLGNGSLPETGQLGQKTLLGQ